MVGAGRLRAVNQDLALAFHLADLADAMTLRWWSASGVAATVKDDGSPTRTAVYSNGSRHDEVLAALARG